MRPLIAALFLLTVSITLAEEAAGHKPMLAVRGKLLKEESFSEADSVAKGNKGKWSIYKGKYEIVGGEMKVSEQKEDGHHPTMNVKLPSKNLIMQCKFKVGDSKWLGLSLDNGKLKEHIFRAVINKSGIQAKRMSGMGPTTKGVNVAEKKLKFETDKWYTLIIEIVGREVCVQIPEAQIVIAGESEGIEQEKDRFEFVSGGENAWFDELKIWEAELNPKWAELKAALPTAPAK